ncbi:DUF4493 domain-containing protein [Parabacteroides sp. AGMB00274]|uniref:DUF4493 domain-containing protein n=1 Tax=Parabacteroides faecalis TaxID=2924040 RepID=A0ABT0C583_9BACT|nr:DUF4493 domain-containing protein [Parabacteroides faecalis]MCI7287408.1 DUF4493 domain-containing protein [Parabacteroides sp.]MCJ2382170.1 DUF4493 domain-containing protein [Parabacteroides faecalis]MDY6253401.1 DUF4493 domain-containing protein [Bacteroidales bacterium]
MVRYTYFLTYCLLCLCWLFTACDDDKNSLASTGYLYLGVEEDNSTLTKSVKPVTDESLRVYLLSSSGDTVKTYDDYLEDVKGEKILLPVGNYQVLVSSSQTAGAAWEAPFYAGKTEEPLEIKSGEITNATVTCKITNTKVTVSYSEKLKATFIDYCDTVSTESGTLIYARDEYRAGYFVSEGDLTARLYLKNKDGNEFTLQRVIRDIKPQYHYNLIYQLSNEGDGDEEAGADFDISVSDEDPTEINCTISIKEEELAGEPKLTLQGGFEEGKITFRPQVDGVAQTPPEASLLMEVPGGIQSVTVKASSLQFEDLPQFDLDTWNLAVAKGFPNIDAETTEAQTLDFTSLLNKLKPDGNKNATHTFVMTVVDKQYQQKEISFSFEIKADVKVTTDKVVLWTSFAVLKGTAGNLEEASFIVREKGGSDKQIKSVTKNEADGTFTALITDLQPGKTYEYQAVAGEDEGSVETFIVAQPEEVPNLGFEEWSERSGRTTGALAGTYSYWTSNEGGKDIYWESGNLGAAINGNQLLYQETTDIVNAPNNKSAARLVSKYVGIAALNLGAFSAGSIFSGIIKEAGSGGATLSYGQLHNGFPTKLEGWYKYEAGDIDYNGSGKDKGMIYVALMTSTQIVSSPLSGTPVRFDPKASVVFAYGELVIDQTVDVYTQFSIPLTYYEGKMPDTGTPVYIIIMATSSKDGDVFTGSTSSVMYVDEFSLDYSYNAECFNGTEYSGLTPVSIKDNQ